MSKYITAALQKAEKENIALTVGDARQPNKASTVILNPRVTSQYFNHLPARKDFSWKSIAVIAGLVILMFAVATAQWMKREQQFRTTPEKTASSKVSVAAVDGGNSELKAKVHEAVAISQSEVAFSVQLVSFDSEARAQEEIKQLTSQGYSAFVFEEKQHFNVCVDHFLDNSSAYHRLVSIKNSLTSPLYKNAFVRVIKK